LQVIVPQGTLSSLFLIYFFMAFCVFLKGADSCFFVANRCFKVVAGHDDDGTGELGDELEIENKKFEDEETL
jgi:hypothetical protein